MLTFLLDVVLGHHKPPALADHDRPKLEDFRPRRWECDCGVLWSGLLPSRCWNCQREGRERTYAA